MIRNERRSFGGPLIGMLKAAFPFKYSPAGVVVLRKFGKNRAKIDLAVSGRTEPAGTLLPVLITTVYARLARRVEFGVLHMKRTNALMDGLRESCVNQLSAVVRSRAINTGKPREDQEKNYCETSVALSMMRCVT